MRKGQPKVGKHKAELTIVIGYKTVREVIDETFPPPRDRHLQVFDIYALSGTGRLFLPSDVYYNGLNPRRKMIGGVIKCGNYETLPTQPGKGEMDVVIAANVIHIVPDRPLLFRQMRNILHSEGIGIIVVRDVHAVGRAQWDAEARNYFASVEWFTRRIAERDNKDYFVVARLSKPMIPGEIYGTHHRVA